MEISIQNNDGLEAELTLKIVKEDYQPLIDKTLKDYSKKMTLPGFRKGHVPLGVVNKMIGKDVKREELDKLLHKGISDYIKENNLKVILSPISTYVEENIDWKGDSFEFSFDIGLKPEFNPNLEALNSLTRYNVELTEADIDREIERLRTEQGNMAVQDTVSDMDGLEVRLQFTELDDDGEPLDGGTDIHKVWKYAELPQALQTLLTGKAKDEKIKANLLEILTTPEIVKLFDMDTLTAKDLNPDFEIEVKYIFINELAELNQDLFDRFLGEGKAQSEDDFRAAMKDILSNYYAQQAAIVLEKDARKEILESTNMPLPSNFLEKYLQMTINADKAAEQSSSGLNLASFEKEMKWHLLAEDLLQKSGEQITENEIMEYAISVVNNELRRSNYRGLSYDKLKEYATNYLSNKDNRSQVTLSIRDQKVLNFITNNINPIQQTVNTTEFADIYIRYTENHNHKH